MTISEWIQIAVVGIPIALIGLNAIFKACGFHKGVMIIEELQDGLEKAQPYMEKARSGDFDLSKEIAKASKQLAAAVPGISDKDINTALIAVAKGNPVKKYGVEFKLDGDGKLSADPTGLVTKLAGKVGKFFKKVF